MALLLASIAFCAATCCFRRTSWTLTRKFPALIFVPKSAVALPTTPADSRGSSEIALAKLVAFRSELVKKWGLAPPPYAYDRENHANARCLSPFFHKLSAKVSFFRGAKGDTNGSQSP